MLLNHSAHLRQVHETVLHKQGLFAVCCCFLTSPHVAATSPTEGSIGAFLSGLVAAAGCGMVILNVLNRIVVKKQLKLK
jgi:hypothetical protein